MSPLFDLLYRSKELMQSEATVLHKTWRHVVQWKLRAQDAIDSEDETEARQLLTVAASWLRLNPDSQPIVDEIDALHLMDRASLAASLIEGAAERLAAASLLVSQQSVASRTRNLAEECRFTSAALRGPDAKA